jgi:glycosyltransferase involved in cell wall biosynthesis
VLHGGYRNVEDRTASSIGDNAPDEEGCPCDVRILQLAQFYPPDIGGEERHVRNLAIALAARGHDVEVITTALPSTGAGRAVEDGVRVHRVRSSAQSIGRLHSDPTRPHAMPVADPAMRRAIRDALTSTNVDVVHAHNWIVNSALAPAKATHTPLVLTLHDYSHVCATKRFMRNDHVCEGPSVRRCIGCAVAHYGAPVGMATVTANAIARRRRARGVRDFLTVSGAVAEHNRLAPAGVRFEVVPNFVPDDVVAPRTTVDPNGPIVYVGDVSVHKGVDVLLSAHRRLPDPPPLLLAGRVEAGIEQLLTPGAELLGPRPHAEIAGLLRRARVVVVPSVWPDPCPTVVLEAMGAGRAVVAAASGGIVDMVEHGATGLLLPPGDVAALADALGGLLPDAARLQAMGDAGRERVRRFTASAVVERVEATYRRVQGAR